MTKMNWNRPKKVSPERDTNINHSNAGRNTRWPNTVGTIRVIRRNISIMNDQEIRTMLKSVPWKEVMSLSNIWLQQPHVDRFDAGFVSGIIAARAEEWKVDLALRLIRDWDLMEAKIK